VNTMRLADLTPGASAIVTAISGASRIASRLMEMGFVPGAVVQVMRRAPFGGPIQYRVHSVSISMRAAEAACISVTNDAAWSEPLATPSAAELQVAAT
jgi:ferrous iron transport protein A